MEMEARAAVVASSEDQGLLQERGARVGGQVGYSVRLDTRSSAATQLLFCTTGLSFQILGDRACLAKTQNPADCLMTLF